MVPLTGIQPAAGGKVMQRILVIGLALLTPLTVSADISDEALVSTCLY